MFAVTQSAVFTDRTEDTQIQTAVQFGQILHVHKNPELTIYYSVAKLSLRSIFYVLQVIPSKPQFFSDSATPLNVIDLRYDPYIQCYLKLQLVTEFFIYTLVLMFT